MRDEEIGLPPEHDLVRGRSRFEPLADGDRVARDDPVLVAWIGHDLSGVHPDPHAEPRLSLREPVEPRHRVAQGDGCADGPESIVLADDRNAEHGHHLVADEILDRAAVMLDDGGARSKCRDRTACTDSGSSRSPSSV